MARRQPDLYQTADALSAHSCRNTRAAWTSPPQREVSEPTTLDERSDSRSALAFPTTTRSSRDIHYPSRNAPQTSDPDPHLPGLVPGFLEADLVAHCGRQAEGGYLYTLILTDIATGWTECLPLLYRSRETVLAALQRAHTLFPFSILGIDTDNGGEFLNEEVVAYCEQEQITFTRGRPYQKRDQCFVEQKNGAIVRQVVGYDRLVGEHASRQLTELYRALCLYVNCFQPSMKLLSKQWDGKKVRYVYDPAKTPRKPPPAVRSIARAEATRTDRGVPLSRPHPSFPTT